jgi:hypothetical protein
MQEEAFKKAAVVVPRLRARLDRLIESVSSELTAVAGEQLRRAALTSRQSIEQLGLLLEGRPQRAEASAPVSAPELGKAAAIHVVHELDDMIREIEDEILNPLEEALPEGDLREVKQQVGRIWGEIVCCLQRPLWLKYPELEPK